MTKINKTYTAQILPHDTQEWLDLVISRRVEDAWRAEVLRQRLTAELLTDPVSGVYSIAGGAA